MKLFPYSDTKAIEVSTPVASQMTSQDIAPRQHHTGFPPLEASVKTYMTGE